MTVNFELITKNKATEMQTNIDFLIIMYNN